jgi:hypothetical protein
MSLKERLEDIKTKMQLRLERGRERTEQQRAEKLRRKMKRFEDLKPGVRKSIIEGRMMNKSTLDVMRDEYERRKFDRESKKKTRKD